MRIFLGINYAFSSVINFPIFKLLSNAFENVYKYLIISRIKYK